ncbi:unnamed protein product [Vitrella brassicaformis CCMP3155]|uniref:Uncharacterized protein n=1 Tax=Vitrella brassicaformis (strain CCMP3155) TaxID=1169540 RepID=A0A0G4G6I1_VITBC|nr:unnamed protein product [Vitrella brassicaformis CCMP3155]|eukprot:CEM23865.1 unnamed protein product [Vitrella brassicaformis CCMP3155]
MPMEPLMPLMPPPPHPPPALGGGLSMHQQPLPDGALPFPVPPMPAELMAQLTPEQMDFFLFALQMVQQNPDALPMSCVPAPSSVPEDVPAENDHHHQQQQQQQVEEETSTMDQDTMDMIQKAQQKAFCQRRHENDNSPSSVPDPSFCDSAEALDQQSSAACPSSVPPLSAPSNECSFTLEAIFSAHKRNVIRTSLPPRWWEEQQWQPATVQFALDNAVLAAVRAAEHFRGPPPDEPPPKTFEPMPMPMPISVPPSFLPQPVEPFRPPFFEDDCRPPPVPGPPIAILPFPPPTPPPLLCSYRPPSPPLHPHEHRPRRRSSHSIREAPGLLPLPGTVNVPPPSCPPPPVSFDEMMAFDGGAQGPEGWEREAEPLSLPPQQGEGDLARLQTLPVFSLDARRRRDSSHQQQQQQQLPAENDRQTSEDTETSKGNQTASTEIIDSSNSGETPSPAVAKPANSPAAGSPDFSLINSLNVEMPLPKLDLSTRDTWQDWMKCAKYIKRCSPRVHSHTSASRPPSPSNPRTNDNKSDGLLPIPRSCSPPARWGNYYPHEQMAMMRGGYCNDQYTEFGRPIPFEHWYRSHEDMRARDRVESVRYLNSYLHPRNISCYNEGRRHSADRKRAERHVKSGQPQQLQQLQREMERDHPRERRERERDEEDSTEREGRPQGHQVRRRIANQPLPVSVRLAA